MLYIIEFNDKGKACDIHEFEHEEGLLCYMRGKSLSPINDLSHRNIDVHDCFIIEGCTKVLGLIDA